MLIAAKPLLKFPTPGETLGKETMNIQSLISLIYPPRCPVCFEILDDTKRKVHEKCEKKLIYVKPPVCLRCGKPVYSPLQEYCMDCFRSDAPIDGGTAVWIYTKEMAQSIAKYKYEGKKEYAGFYVDRAVRQCGEWICQRRPDCITAVPLNPRKQRMRGFNQALLIAQGIGKMLNIPVDNELLVRSRYTEPQKNLTPTQRLKNLQKAFGPGKNIRKYKSVLLVDDIYTTGSTAKICSSILKGAGVSYVWILNLCIGSDY